MSKQERNKNAYRVGKSRFDAALTHEERVMVDKVKILLSSTTDRSVLIALCRMALS